MAKSIFYHLFGFGKFPKKYRDAMEDEGVLYKDDGLAIVVRYRRFRCPTAYYGHKVSLVFGSVMLTKVSFACFRNSWIPPVFHIATADDAFKAFEFSMDEKSRLRVMIDAPRFQEGWQGTIDCRIPTENAKQLIEMLESID